MTDKGEKFTRLICVPAKSTSGVGPATRARWRREGLAVRRIAVEIGALRRVGETKGGAGNWATPAGLLGELLSPRSGAEVRGGGSWSPPGGGAESG